MNKLNIKIRVRGIDGVLKKLSEAEKEKVIPALQRGIHKSAYIVEASAKKYAPVDTGRLRKSIRTVRGKMSAMVTTNVKYAPYQEFGTSRARAQPFLRPALKSNSRKIEKTVATEVKRAISSI